MNQPNTSFRSLKDDHHDIASDKVKAAAILAQIADKPIRKMVAADFSPPIIHREPGRRKRGEWA
jgi:hypothetical protein